MITLCKYHLERETHSQKTRINGFNTNTISTKKMNYGNKAFIF